MIYLIILIIFNLLIIGILSNVKKPSFNKLSKYKIAPIMMLQNTGVPISQIDINKYHSIYKKLNEKAEGEKKND